MRFREKFPTLGGWWRPVLLVLMLVNMASCYKVATDHPLLAVGHALMAVVFFLLFLLAGLRTG